MCVSAPVDAAVGTAVVAVAVDAFRHGRDRRDQALAALPLLLGAHQLVEAVVWLGAEGSVPRAAMQHAVAAYLVIAFVLPVLVPAVVLAREDDPARRQLLGALVVLGAGVAAVLLASVARGPVGVSAEAVALRYQVGVPWAELVTVLYVAATCGALVASREPAVARFGAVNLLAVPAIAWLAAEAFVSLWCAWAAVVSVAVARYVRAAPPAGERSGTPLPARR